jgi:hypothetical protein
MKTKNIGAEEGTPSTLEVGEATLTPLSIPLLTRLIELLRTAPPGQMDEALRRKTVAYEPTDVAEAAHFLMAEIGSHENFFHDRISTFVLTMCDLHSQYTWEGKPEKDPGLPDGYTRAEICSSHREIRAKLGL